MSLRDHYLDKERFALADELFDLSLIETLEHDIVWEDCVTLGNKMYDRGFRRASTREHRILYRRKGNDGQSFEALLTDTELDSFMDEHPKEDWVIFLHHSRPVGLWINELL